MADNRMNDTNKKDYWANLLSTIDLNRVNLNIPREPLKKLSYANETFQIGIILLVNLRETEGMSYLKEALDIYLKFHKFGVTSINQYVSDDPDFFSRQFFCNFLLEDKPAWNNLNLALDIQYNQLHRLVIRYNCQDINDTVRELLPLEKTDRKIPPTESKFHNESDKYPYETIADQLVGISRRHLFLGQATKAALAASKAMDLYDNSVERVYLEKVKKNTKQRKRKKHKTQLTELLNVFRKSGNVDLVRGGMMGNIPLFYLQAELLKNIAGSVMEPRKTIRHNIGKEMTTFFKIVISSEDRMESMLGLIEELEWAFIRKTYNDYLYGKELKGNWSEVLRKIFLDDSW